MDSEMSGFRARHGTLKARAPSPGRWEWFVWDSLLVQATAEQAALEVPRSRFGRYRTGDCLGAGAFFNAVTVGALRRGDPFEEDPDHAWALFTVTFEPFVRPLRA